MDDCCISTQVTRALVRHLEKSGVDLARFFLQTDYSRDYLCSPQKWVSIEDFIELLSQAREATGENEIAVFAGRMLIESRKEEFIRRPGGCGNVVKSMQMVLDWVAQIYPLARAEINQTGRRELQVRVSKAKDYKHTRDHCLFFKGILESILAINGFVVQKSSELTCMMPDDEPGRNHEVNKAGDEKPVVQYEAANIPGENPEWLEKDDPEHFSQFRGIRNYANFCTYELKWKNSRPAFVRLWKSTIGSLLELFKVLFVLEKAPMMDSATYQKISLEWQRWIGWEESYSLTKAKYLAYFGVVALSALPIAGHFFEDFDNSLFRGFSNLALSGMILAFGIGITKLQIGYARQLHRQKEQSDRFMQQAGVGVTMLNQDHEIVFANPLMTDLYGEILGRKCHQVFRWQSDPCPDCKLQKAFKDKTQVQMEVKNVTRQGQERWFYTILTPIFDRRDQVIGVLQISTDITGKKELEFELAKKRVALEASEYKYRNFMANAADAIIVTDLAGRLIESSHQLYRMLEIENEAEAQDLTLLENMAYGAEEKHKLALVSQAMIRDGSPKEFELRLQCRSGKIIDAEVRAIPILSDGELSWMQFIMRDVTERKRREFEKNLMLSVSKAIKDAPSLPELLEKSLEGICAIMDVPIAAIFLKDAGQPQLQLAAQIGRSPEATKRLARIAIDGSASARNIASRSAMLNRPIVVEDVRQLKMDSSMKQRVDLMGVSSLICMPMVMESKLQGVIQLATRDTKFFDQDKINILTQMADELAVGIARQRLRDELAESNSRLRQKHQELENATLQLLQSEKMASIGQLAAGIAHEINNPMGFINANLNVLDEYRGDLEEMFEALNQFCAEVDPGQLNPAQLGKYEKLSSLKEQMDGSLLFNDFRSLIKESQEGAERVKKIILNLKDFSHPTKGEPESADINAGLDTTLNIVWNELKYKAEVKKEYGKLPKVVCYPQELNQVFMNILVNAAQAIPDKGEITLKTWADNGDIYVRISDTGAGIPQENLPKIFDPFFTTKEVGKGTGLGLSISYGIVKKHNGDITVESEAGRGSSFTVRLPIEGPEAGKGLAVEIGKAEGA
jgi:PAS domain S-box-containing protein